MPDVVLQAQLVLQRWDSVSGLIENVEAFASLDELYAFCLSTSDPQLIDRIVIRGRDDNGQERILTFIFQSITVTPKPDPS